MTFPKILAAILNFCVKRKNKFISETEQDRPISTKFLTHRVFAESINEFSPKKVFPPLLAAILNFCVNRKRVFILETEQDRSILTKFLAHRLSAESIIDFSQKSFSRHFWRPS